jgi:membrane protein required for beta-lactamase induction
VTGTAGDGRRLTRDPRLWRVIIAASIGVHSLENALRGVLIAAGVLTVAMSAVLVALGRRRVPATASPVATARS